MQRAPPHQLEIAERCKAIAPSSGVQLPQLPPQRFSCMVTFPDTYFMPFIHFRPYHPRAVRRFGPFLHTFQQRGRCVGTHGCDVRNNLTDCGAVWGQTRVGQSNRNPTGCGTFERTTEYPASHYKYVGYAHMGVWRRCGSFLNNFGHLSSVEMLLAIIPWHMRIFIRS